MYLGNKLTKKEIQDYVRTNSGGLLYEPYHKGEFRIKNPVREKYYLQSEPVIDVKDKYITYPINIDFDGKTWNTDWSSEYHINYHILPEKMVYEIINNIILALKDCIVESKKMDIEKDFING
jgi:hypothetical protein